MPRVVQVSFHADTERRDGAALLRAWPTLPGVATAAARAGVEIVVVQRAHRDEVLEQDSVRFHFVADADAECTRVIERVVSLRPEVVHVQGLNQPWPTRLLARALGALPVIAQDHGSVPPGGLRALGWRRAFRGLAGVAFTARTQADPWFHAGVFRRGLPVYEVLEGSSDFTPGDRATARAAMEMSGNPCLLWTGRLDANKDPFTMLAAVERAVAVLPDLRLYCCFGDAPLLKPVEHRVRQSPLLAPRVVLLGTRPHEELQQRYRAADIFLQTSHREGSGYSLIEALACGATPVVTDIPAARAIVGDVGELVAVEDIDALSAAIVRVASQDADTLRARARARFDQALTFDAIGRQWLGAYTTVARASAMPASRDAAVRRDTMMEARQ
jgi:glycosyltransferase involved in cell wall biosynthesis